MKRVLRWAGYVLAAILLVLLLFAAWVWFASSRVIGATHEARPERLEAASAAQRADAERQARILGCVSCHGEGLRGRMMFDGGPFARVWAPNLAALAPRISDQQLAQGIRQGIGHDGRALFVMPSPMYSRLSDQEVSALIGWIRSLPAEGEATPPIQWGPVGRVVMALGKLQPVMARMDEFRTRQPFDTGPDQAAGRRIAANVCSECHGADLSGGEPAPDILAPDLSLVGAYDAAQFTRLMRTGRPPNGRELGLMREIAEKDTRLLTDEEIAQLYAYLSTRAERVAR
jgi:cytochrome c553